MAEEHQHTSTEGGEIKDRGLFDFLGKKKEEEKPQEEVVVTELEKVHISPAPSVKADEKEEKPSLLEKLHRSGSSSSSSSEEEVEEGGEKKKKKKEKKKGLKEKIEEKFSGDKKEEGKVVAEDTTVPVVKCDDIRGETAEEKKGFLDMIKEKIPGQTKKAEDGSAECFSHSHEGEPPKEKKEVESPKEKKEVESPKEKKGILEKIKEKLPGYHKNEGEEAAGH